MQDDKEYIPDPWGGYQSALLNANTQIKRPKRLTEREKDLETAINENRNISVGLGSYHKQAVFYD